MFDVLLWVLLSPFLQVAEFFVWLYQADDRPVARRFTLGCAAVVAIVALVVVLVVSW